jgi:cellulose biosynthesis protein BcsQ
MAETLAIISGKGGSGKTTIAISLAQLLATSGKCVLLVDCDMSTHGATYFFESQLTEKDKYITFMDIVYCDSYIGEFTNKKKFIVSNTHKPEKIMKAAPNISFIPSCVDFPSKTVFADQYNDDENQSFNRMKDFFSYINDFGYSYIQQDGYEKPNPYDIIIFDCQAGYSHAAELVTKYSNKVLAVLEADAISASSIRVLYSQLSEQLDGRQTYQIFNKITKEEQELYSKLVHGTLFTNLTPILFDWNVRKAFVTNDLPNIGASNPVLTNSVYELATVLFPKFKEDLRDFIITVKEKMLSSLRDQRREIKYTRYQRLFSRTFQIIAPVYGIIAAVSLIMLLIFNKDVSDLFNADSSYVFIYIYAVLLVLVLMIMQMQIILRKKQSNNDTQKNQFELKLEEERLEEEINQLIQLQATKIAELKKIRD